MKVRAIEKGYYGMDRIKPGEIFHLVPVKGKKLIKNAMGREELVPHVFSVEEQFSSKWMEKVEDDAESEDAEAFGKRKALAAKEKAKSAFGAKKKEAVGYSASLEPKDEPDSPTGEKKVI